MLPNVISRLGSQDIINLILAVEGNRGDDKSKEVLSKLKGMLIQRVFDNKNAQHLFDKFERGK
ncbi:hypothetical protein VL10_23945 [Leclercia adecarboxylata]|nr:hypothetical protein VL10_23945 [Leclercia adecarboxylata]KMN66734.1 hypothetical protein VK95_04385 [Leclercia sp. LK8]